MIDTNHKKPSLQTTSWLRLIREGRRDLMEEFYIEKKEEFLGWGRSFSSLGREELTDVYQDAHLIFYEKIMSGKLMDLKSEPGTFLIGIAKNLILAQYRKSVKEKQLQSTILDDSKKPDPTDDRLEDLSKLAMKLLGEMTEPCKSILELFYYKSLQLVAIAEQLNYKNTDVVKTQKSRCLRNLKEKMLEAAKL